MKKNDSNLYSYDEDLSNRREFIRVSPLSETPVVLDFQGQSAALLDISAGGLACKGIEASLGQELQVRFDLPGEKHPVESRVKITAVSGNGILHCEFLGLTQDMADAIHHFVLNVQKETIRKTRK